MTLLDDLWNAIVSFNIDTTQTADILDSVGQDAAAERIVLELDALALAGQNELVERRLRHAVHAGVIPSKILQYAISYGAEFDLALLSDIQSDISGVQGAITAVENDIAAVQGDVVGVQGDIVAVQGSLNTNITSLQNEINALEGEVDTVLLRTNDVLNAIEYNIVPNSSSDQTIAIESFLVIAANAGKVAYFPPGVYLMAQADVPANCRIMGAGRSTIFRRVVGTATTVLALQGSDIMIHDLVVDSTSGTGQSNPVAGIFGGGCARVRIERCRFVNIKSAGIWIYNGGREATISSCDFLGPGSGIQVQTYEGLSDYYDVEISRNRITCTDPDAYGIVARSDGHNAAVPVTMYDVRITNNYVHMVGGTGTNQFYGFGIESWAHDVVIANNEIHYDSAIGDTIGISAIVWNASVNANIVENAGLGIEAGYVNVSYTGNAIRGCRSGMMVWGEAERCAVTGNVIEGFTYWGIALRSDYCTVTGNVLKGSGRVAQDNVWGILFDATTVPNSVAEPTIVGNSIYIETVSSGGVGTLNIGIACVNVGSFCIVGNKVRKALVGIRYGGDAGLTINGVIVGNELLGVSDAASRVLHLGSSTTGELARWANSGDSPTITGSRGGNAALASLLTTMQTRDVIINSTTT